MRAECCGARRSQPRGRRIEWCSPSSRVVPAARESAQSHHLLPHLVSSTSLLAVAVSTASIPITTTVCPGPQHHLTPSDARRPPLPSLIVFRSFRPPGHSFRRPDLRSCLSLFNLLFAYNRLPPPHDVDISIISPWLYPIGIVTVTIAITTITTITTYLRAVPETPVCIAQHS